MASGELAAIFAEDEDSPLYTLALRGAEAPEATEQMYRRAGGALRAGVDT